MDLNHAQTTPKSRDTRFLERVFSPEEKDILQADSQPEAMLWALWTGKEAAYKVLQKERGEGIPSTPRLYSVQFTEESPPESGSLPPFGERLFTGIVSTPAGKIFLSTLLASKYVHTIATSSLPTADVVWEVERMPGEQPTPSEESAFVRAAAINYLARHLSVTPADLEIIRHRGMHGLDPPRVYLHGQEAAVDISLSHDGAYAAYAFGLAL
ncbi:MAG: 4'-phosphopantetheinyl transferase superfamily protein [Syntrophales bacterium]